jgi:16S rRNA (uracil1498-N3)-methyltransferase
MRKHRVHHAPLEPSIALSQLEGDHLRVLRVNVGDEISVFDGAGLEAIGMIEALEPIITLRLGEIRSVNLEPPQPVTLCIALLKGDKLADVVRGATELGVANVQLLVTDHADAREIGAQKLERLRRIAGEAAKQCGRNVIPTVLEPVRIRDLEPVERGVVAHPRSSVLMRDVATWDAPISVATGPEGGFSRDEIAALERLGFTAVTLGVRILRAETAPIALLGALIAGEGF